MYFFFFFVINLLIDILFYFRINYTESSEMQYDPSIMPYLIINLRSGLRAAVTPHYRESANHSRRSTLAVIRVPYY